MELIAVGALVGLALLFGLRSLHNALSGKPPSCACGHNACCSETHCPEKGPKLKEKHHG